MSKEGDKFMMKMSQLIRPGRQILLAATAALALTGSVFAQGTSAATSKPAAEGGYSRWEITPTFGWDWFQIFQDGGSGGFTTRYKNGWTFGERFGADLGEHFGVEASFGLGRNRFLMKPSGQNAYASLVTFNTFVNADLVYNFQRRTANNRFFILAGPSGVWSGIRSTVPPSAIGTFAQPLFPPKREPEAGINMGVGLKHYFNRYLGVRFELDSRITKKAHYALPQNPTGPNSLYVPHGGADSALIANIGLILREGWVPPPPPPNPLVSQSLRVDVPGVSGAAPAISGAHNVCPGDDLRLTVNANGFANPTYQWMVGGAPAAGGTSASFSVPTASGSGARSVTVQVGGSTSVGTSAPFATTAGHTYHLTAEPMGLAGRSATYQWMAGGQPISGATSSSLDLPDDAAKSITVRVTAPNAAVTSAPVNFTINALTPPALTFAVNPSTVPYNSGPIALSANATASSCGGTATVRYSGEGVTGSSFNPGSVSGFDMANRVKQQSKVVTITATATDAKGQTTTRTANVTVTLGTEARRLDDVVFQSMSSRVNNCGKRLLIEELTPMLRNDPGAKVILIGHRDEKEKGSKAALKLDETRALNAAAVLSAGKGVCPQLDLGRIMMKAAGTDQSDTPRPALCGSSTNVKEKSGQAIKDSDKNAQFRRVEVWFVPSGAADPAGVSGATAVPAAAVTKLGCPK